jgi:hypothetical protein
MLISWMDGWMVACFLNRSRRWLIGWMDEWVVNWLIGHAHMHMHTHTRTVVGLTTVWESWVGLGKLLLALTSAVILGSESRRIHDHIFLLHDSGSCAAVLSGCPVGQSGKLLLVLASTVILGSESSRTHDHILLSSFIALAWTT